MATKPSYDDEHRTTRDSGEQKAFSLPMFSSPLLIAGGYPRTSRRDSQSWRQEAGTRSGEAAREVIASLGASGTGKEQGPQRELMGAGAGFGTVFA